MEKTDIKEDQMFTIKVLFNNHSGDILSREYCREDNRYLAEDMESQVLGGKYIKMGIKLYTSDLHFGHRNVIGFDHRPFNDVDEMDRCLIELWNGRVSSDDEVYIVGDLCFRNGRPAEWYLKQLKGHKHLVIGNHDQKLLENDKAMSYFESVDKMMYIKDEDKNICLCHYPIAEWNHFHRGSYHIYGHIHNRTDGAYMYMKNLENALNAGCMINNYTPVSFNELVRNNRIFKEKN